MLSPKSSKLSNSNLRLTAKFSKSANKLKEIRILLTSLSLMGEIENKDSSSVSFTRLNLTGEIFDQNSDRAVSPIIFNTIG